MKNMLKKWSVFIDIGDKLMNFKTLLNNEELEFIKDRYPDVDTDNFELLAAGLSSNTNLDILEGSVRYDIEQKDFSDGRYKGCDDGLDAFYMCLNIKKKIEKYRKNLGRTLIAGFDIEQLCKEADAMSRRAFGAGIGTEIYRNDRTVDNLLDIIPYSDDPELERTKSARCLGTSFGEFMLKDYFLKEGYDWCMVDEYSHPVICKPETRIIIDPIGFIQDRLEEKIERRSISCENFYWNKKDVIRKFMMVKRHDIIGAHIYSSNNKPELEKGEKCGCFCCKRIYNSLEITDWVINENVRIDRLGTAICPYCGCDSVIGEDSGYPITEDFLEKMNRYWF